MHRCITLVSIVVLFSTVVGLMPAQASHSPDLYFIKFTQNENQVRLSPSKAVGFLNNVILPSLLQIHRDKRILGGGLLIGARAGVFIMKASSPKEIAEFIRMLPAWGIWTWEIIPLERFSDRVELEKTWMKTLKR